MTSWPGWRPEDFAAVRRPVAEASHAPGLIYASPDVYRLEVERLFRRDWLLVGREEELPEPGDDTTLRIADEPIIVARGRDDDLHAFYNMCAHRGVEVVQGSGRARSFACPYHGWTYDLDGRLLGAGYMKDCVGFDAASERLRPLRLDTWRHNGFVSFDPAAPPLAEHVAEFEQDFAFLRPDACWLGNRLTLVLDCNWKFVPENLIDFYHVGVLHASRATAFDAVSLPAKPSATARSRAA